MSVNIANLASNQKWSAVKSAVMKETADLESRADYSHDDSGMGYTATLYAAYFNNTEMFSWLAQRGADVFAVDANRKTALHIAAKYGSAAVVRQLLMEGLDPDQKDKWGRVPQELTTDRRGVIIHGGKKLTQKDLVEVNRTFKLWPTISSTYNEKGIEGLKVLATVVGGELGKEAAEYVELETLDTEIERQKSKTEPEIETKATEDETDEEEDDEEEEEAEDEDNEEEEPDNKKPDDEEEQKPDVFISYCWADKELVRKLADDLREAGYKVWIDVGQMGGGDALYEQIDKGMRGCRVVVSSVSPRYAKSVNCRREVSLAADIQKPIVPIIVDDQSKSQWPPVGPMGFLLAGKLYVDVTSDYTAGREQLMDALAKFH